MAVGWRKKRMDGKCFKEKMSRTSPLIGFESHTRNVSLNWIPKFVACGLGSMYQETIVRNRKITLFTGSNPVPTIRIEFGFVCI